MNSQDAHETKKNTFQVLSDLRETVSTEGAERLLLINLILRCDHRRGWFCWPSYARLAIDTNCDVETLRRAAKRLEDRSLITRQVRNHTSNIFHINVLLLEAQAQAVRDNRGSEDAGLDD